eukprot:COSAG01_NODE_33873_length_557_cov_0.790393_1_plen_58_part_00
MQCTAVVVQVLMRGDHAQALADTWARLGNPVYKGFYAQGGHCGIHSYGEVLRCLIGD